MKKAISKKRLNEWVKWSRAHMKNSRVDPFLQGWACAFGVIFETKGIPEEVRREIFSARNYAESLLWSKLRKDKNY